MEDLSVKILGSLGLILMFLTLTPWSVDAQTEGDIGYDYIDAYDEEYDEFSAQFVTEGDIGYDYKDAYDDEYDEFSVLGLEPVFDVAIVNVTVVQGQTAVLPCSIDYLGKYKVAWLNPYSVPLTYEGQRVMDDTRFDVVRPYIKEWNLRISDVNWQDQGMYRCTINTTPQKSKIVMLHVKVPASIIDELSSDDVTVQESDTVILICNVTGVPRPEVTWYRRPADAKNEAKERMGMIGEMLIIQNVSRYCDDIYECVADNGVPPAISRQMRVTVEFPPEITMPNRRIAQETGKDTILECIITAFPHAVNYWEVDGRQIMSTSKYRTDAYEEGDHTITLSLRIQDIEPSDYGEYKCIAANRLGRDVESMWLVEYVKPAPPVNTPPNVKLGGKDWWSTTPHSKTQPKYNIESKTVKSRPDAAENKVNHNKNTVPASGRVLGNGGCSFKVTFSLWFSILAAICFNTRGV